MATAQIRARAQDDGTHLGRSQSGSEYTADDADEFENDFEKDSDEHIHA